MDYKDVCILNDKTPIHQLNKLNETGADRYNFFPISIIQAIYDKTGIRLDTIISSFNYIFLPWKGTKEDTRLQVVGLMRRKSLVICYRDLDDNVIIEMYNSNERGDNSWKSDNNWKDFVGFLIDVVKDIFSDINNYDELKQIIENIINEWINENLGDKIETIVNEYLTTLDFGEIVNNVITEWVDEHPEYFNNIINQYLNDNLEDLVGEFFSAIVTYLRDNERVIANALARHEQAITELQNASN